MDKDSKPFKNCLTLPKSTSHKILSQQLDWGIIAYCKHKVYNRQYTGALMDSMGISQHQQLMKNTSHHVMSSDTHYHWLITLNLPPWTCHPGPATLDLPPWTCHPGPVTLDLSSWTCLSRFCTIVNVHVYTYSTHLNMQYTYVYRRFSVYILCTYTMRMKLICILYCAYVQKYIL